MVVDHDAWTRAQLTATLSEVGVQFAQASNGMTALRHAQADPPHVMIVGAALPELSSTELIDLLRCDSRTRHVAIVGTDADAQLPVPFTPLDVLATMLEALEVRRQAGVATPIRSVIASPRPTWPLVEGEASRSSSRIRNAGRSGKWRLSSGIETL